MRAFAALYAAIERTTSTNAKIAALTTYFRETPPADAAWAVYFLSGRRLLRLLPSKLLRQWTLEEAWRGDELVPVAKAYSGLSNDEIETLDRWVRANTLEKFGPVRRVTPLHVFEIAFENVQRSSRHKSGVAVRFPRIARWRTDKRPEEADRIETLEALIRST